MIIGSIDISPTVACFHSHDSCLLQNVSHGGSSTLVDLLTQIPNSLPGYLSTLRLGRDFAHGLVA